MEIVDLQEFDEAFYKVGNNMTLDPLFSTAKPLFTTSLKWLVHNDYHYYNLGETVFE